MTAITTPDRKARDDRIDALRFFAFCVVVVLHAFSSPAITSLQTSAFVDSLCRVAVPCFFLISGWLVPQTIADPVGYLVKVLARLLPIFVAWEAVYLAGDALGLPLVSPGATWHAQSLAFHVVNTLTEGGLAYHLWFLPSLFLSIAAFVFVRHCGGRWAVAVVAITAFLLGLAVGPYNEVTGIYDLLARSNPAAATVTARNGICFGLIFIAVGNALARHPSTLAARPLLVAALIVGATLQQAEFALLAGLSRHGRALAIDYGFGTLVYATAAFLLTRTVVAGPTTARMAILGRYAVGMYCLHVLFLELIRNTLLVGLGYDGAAALATRAGLAAVVIVLSVAVTLTLARLAPLRRIVA